MDRSDGLEEFPMQGTFQQVPPSAGLHRPQHLSVPCIRCQHNDSRFGSFVANGHKGVEPVHLRHLQVHQHNVRMVRPELLDRFASVGGLPDDSHIRLAADEASDALTQNGVVVNHEDPNSDGVGTHDFSSVSFPENLPADFCRKADRRRSSALRYARAEEMHSSISVPASSSLQTVSLPPITLARSRMPGKPKWPSRPSCSLRTFASMPFPSSRTRRRS